MTDLRVRWLRADERSAAARTWLELESRHGAEVACSWTWTDTWLEHYGDVVAHRFAVVQDAGRPCAIALVCRSERRRAGVRLRRLHLGTAGEPPGTGVFVENNDVLADPALAEAALAALARALRSSSWDQLALDGFSVLSADRLLAHLPPARVIREALPMLALPQAGDITVALGSSTRRSVRRSVRRAGDIRLEEASDGEHAARLLGELARLSRVQWASTQRTSAWESDRFEAFHRAVVRRLMPEGRARVLAMYDDDGLLGGSYGLIVGDAWFDYQSARRVTASKTEGSPGQVLQVLGMQAAADGGLRNWCHGVGESEHKRRLSSHSEELVWAVVDGRRARALRGGRRVAGRVRGSLARSAQRG